MYNQSFDNNHLRQFIKRKDVFQFQQAHRGSKSPSEDLLQSIQNALDDFEQVDFYLLTNTVGGKRIYRLQNPVDSVLQRRLSNIVRRIKCKRFEDRNNVVKHLKNTLLTLPPQYPFRVLKYDISKFFESVDVSEFANKVNNDPIYTNLTRTLLIKYLKNKNKKKKFKLFRGTPLSSIIAEVIMEEFDSSVQNFPGILLYKRYVDDIIIVADEQFASDLKRQINSVKKKWCKWNKDKTCDVAIEAGRKKKKCHCVFEYLGYRFNLLSEYKKRDLTVDFSTARFKRMQSRIVKSFLDYDHNNDLDLLRKRVRFLTSNYKLKLYGKNLNALSGIYYNNLCLTDDAFDSLKKLDRLLVSNVKIRKIGDKTINKSSFYLGYMKRRFVYFNSSDLLKIQKCWKYGE